jgi:hypothetical protein
VDVFSANGDKWSFAGKREDFEIVCSIISL